MNTTTIARAWAITRSDGLELGFTDHDTPLAFAGLSFRPELGLVAQAVVQGAGLSVDNSETVGALSDGAIEEADILAGRWDGAELRQWEVDWSDTKQHRLIFRGHLGEVTRAGGAFKAELRGLSEPLNQPVGRVFHPRCSASLGMRLAAPILIVRALVVKVSCGKSTARACGSAALTGSRIAGSNVVCWSFWTAPQKIFAAISRTIGRCLAVRVRLICGSSRA